MAKESTKETTDASFQQEDNHKNDQPSHQPSQALTSDNEDDYNPEL
jgi:hypothetical protein